MATRVVASLHKVNYSLVLFFYYEFYKILDISFHTNTLHSPLGNISSVNHRLKGMSQNTLQ